jgi:hypothetical protein
MLSVEDVYGNSAVTAQSIQQSDSPPESSLPPSPTSSTSSAALIDEQQLVNKITWRLIPFIGWLYMLSFLDRVNLAKYRLFDSVAERWVFFNFSTHLCV